VLEPTGAVPSRRGKFGGLAAVPTVAPPDFETDGAA
jgi:hypothetical protein